MEMLRFFPCRAVAVVPLRQRVTYNAVAEVSDNDMAVIPRSVLDFIFGSPQARSESNRVTENRIDMIDSIRARLARLRAKKLRTGQASPFLKLPTELRLEIYRLCFATDIISSVSQPRTKGCFDLLLINWQIHHEVRDAMRRDAVFTINLAIEFFRFPGRSLKYYMDTATFPNNMLSCSSRVLENFTKFYIHIETPLLWCFPEIRHWEHTLCCLLAPEWNRVMYQSKAFHVSIDIGSWGVIDVETRYILKAVRRSKSTNQNKLVMNRGIAYCDKVVLTEIEKVLLKRKGLVRESMDSIEKDALARYGLVYELAQRALEIPGATARIENRKNGRFFEIKEMRVLDLIFHHLIATFFMLRSFLPLTNSHIRNIHIGFRKMANIADSYSDPIRIAVIGGTGLQSLAGFTPVASLNVETPWGTPSSPISVLHHSSSSTGKPIPVAFISRHGLYHEKAPHEVPSRANIAALRSLGVRTIIAFSAVGSLQEAIKPRDFVIPDQIIDRTKGIRPFTFFEGGMVGHVGFADPFDNGVGEIVKKCGHSLAGEGVVLHDKGTIVCMEGPQFSTRAESNLYRQWGGSVINMSALPEAKLAREAEIAYQMICMSTDYDCWHSSGDDVTVEMVMGNMKANAENARRFVGAVLDELSKEEHADLVSAKHLENSMKFAGGMTAAQGRTAEAKEKLGWLFPGYFN
ncbi:Hypothetical protein R9X50_00141000 [Acrodontium crateriforme]|uniref:S-methyl-5'-thioadenosine phosphorylase n=1 Tax=Acrodontium crateriforme TaxID=150365 RepID=A0AAQ3RA20_9PEZI|nr:Hypothetical protein R9X50_00141000 [Acrodontium crateriforme]